MDSRSRPSPSDYRDNVEAHDRGAVLVATVFDAFQRIYKHRTRDLLRHRHRAAPACCPKGASARIWSPARRGGGEIAEHLLHICIRALDYCPPIDITFGDYLRALITADLDIAPDDERLSRRADRGVPRARHLPRPREHALDREPRAGTRPELHRKQQSGINTIAKLTQERAPRTCSNRRSPQALQDVEGEFVQSS